MAPTREAGTGPRLTTVPAEAAHEEDTSKVYSFGDPTFDEAVRRLDWGVGDWTLRGPAFEDGTYPMIHIEWRLGEILLKLLHRWARVSLSRSQRKALEKGEPITRIRFAYKNTPATGPNSTPASSEGNNTETQEGP